MWGVGAFAILFIFAKDIAMLFNTDPEVVKSAMLFLQILPISYFAWGFGMVIQSTLYSLRKPIDSALLLAIRLAVIMIPFAYLGATFFGLSGLYIGITLSQFIGVPICYWFYLRAKDELFVK